MKGKNSFSIKTPLPRRVARFVVISLIVLAALALPPALGKFAQTVWAASPPAVTNVTPSIGPIAGGQSVTITGSNFYAGYEFK